MRGHAEGQVCERPECLEIGCVELGLLRIDHRQPLMTVGGGAAVPRQVLEHGQDPAFQKPRRGRARDDRDLVRRLAIGAIPDHLVGAGDRHVGERQAVDVDPECHQIGRDQPRAEPGRRETRIRIAVVDPAIGGARRIGRPKRRTETLHPAALLVDQNGRLAAQFM